MKKTAKKTKGERKNKIKMILNKIKNFLNENKIFFEIFSYVVVGVMGIILSFAGTKINKRTMEIYETQLKIMENENSPYFDLESEEVWDKVEETQNTDKIASVKYTLTNNGGKIKNVTIRPESYTIFYVPTGIQNEWYIFKYMTNNFRLYKPIRMREEEKGRKFVFYEYTSEKLKDKMDKMDFELAKYLSKNLDIEENLRNEVTYSNKDILYIDYIDYMGEEKRKIFVMYGSELEELENDIEGVYVGLNLNAILHDKNKKLISLPIDTNDVNEVGKRLKKEIEEWLQNNRGAEGYKDSAHWFNNYDLEIYNTEVDKYETESSEDYNYKEDSKI